MQVLINSFLVLDSAPSDLEPNKVQFAVHHAKRKMLKKTLAGHVSPSEDS